MKKYKIILSFAVFIGLIFYSTASASDGTSIHLKIQAADSIIYDADLILETCENAPSSSIFTANGLCALDQSAVAYSVNWWDSDAFLDIVSGYANNADGNGIYWNWFANGIYGQTALNKHELAEGERLVLTYNANPLQIAASDAEPLVNTTTTLSVKEFGFDESWNAVWNTSINTTIVINGTEYFSESGQYDLYFNTTTPYSVYAKKAGTVTSETITIAPKLPNKSIGLRVEASDGTLFDQNITVNACENIPNSNIYTINGYCAVAQSGLENNWSWWGEDVFLNSLASHLNNADGNGIYWTWFDNLEYGQIALNKHELDTDETLLLTYNKNPLRISASSSTPALGNTTTLRLEQFGFDESWNAVWSSTPSGTIVINDIEYLAPEGEYELAIATTTPYIIYGKKDGYITSESVTITGYETNDAGDDENNDNEEGDGNDNNEDGNDNNNNGGGGGGTPSYQKINIGAAVNFLNTKHTDGDFGSTLLTDWAAVAFAADGTSAAKEQVKNYLIANTDAAGGMNSVSDNARRAIALMSLGVNPYSGTGVNYIKKITDTFDGTQFGDNSLYNDDIFALLVLLKAGYDASDPMLMSDIGFILSKQNDDGSFGGTDMTAAAVQALSLADGVSGVANALTKARSYLLANQGADGSFAGPTPAMTTAWAIQAIAGAYSTDLANNYLYTRQTADGGVEPASADNTTRIWATAYAIPAALGRTWGSIMQSFSVPAGDPIPPSSPNSGNAAADTATTVTTTAIITTTTLDLATPTSTPTTTIEIITTTLEIAAETGTPNEKILLTDRTKPKKSSAPSLDHTAPETMPTSSSPTLSTASTTQPAITNDLVNTLPLDTPSRQAAKKLLAISGGGALTVGLYLGLKLLKIVV